MVYYIGDTHGDFFKVIKFIVNNKLTSDDTIVILGDACFNYFGNDDGDIKNKQKVNVYKVNIFCIHGNHEMRPNNLPYYHEETWCGGTVFVEDDYPYIKFAKDGEVYDLDGWSTLVIGGAYSVDKYYRLLHGIKWFEDEQPIDSVKESVINKLESINWTVDQVLTHTCPSDYIPTEAFLPGINQSRVDNSTEYWLTDIEHKLDYKIWRCGHWHIDKHIDKIHFMMDNFETNGDK